MNDENHNAQFHQESAKVLAIRQDVKRINTFRINSIDREGEENMFWGS